MAKRRREPEESLGPAIDGLDQLERLEMALRHPPEVEEPEEEPEPAPPPDPHVILICGRGERALATARLGRACGFAIELAEKEALPDSDELAALADVVHVLEDYENIVADCGIDRNHYVCIFANDAADCEHILYQCLESGAPYLGAWAGKEMAKEIHERLKEAGAPDAELAAICCPMGLGIGAKTPEQEAVAIIAEIMAAKSGVKGYRKEEGRRKY